MGSFGDAHRSHRSSIARAAATCSTTRRGDRRRTVQKAVAWLQGHLDDDRAMLALVASEDAELAAIVPLPVWAQAFERGN